MERKLEVRRKIMLLKMNEISSDTPTAEAHWVLIYIHFPIYLKAYKSKYLDEYMVYSV